MYRDASELEKREFLDLVQSRDSEGLYHLITELSPYTLWGGITNNLSEEDQRWVREATEEASQKAGSSRH